MHNTPSLSSLIKQAAEQLPESAASLRAELTENLRPLLENKLGELNLVTRAEFEQQLELLERLEARLATLEAQLAEMDRPN